MWTVNQLVLMERPLAPGNRDTMQRAMVRQRSGLSLIVVSAEGKNIDARENIDARAGWGCHPDQSSGSDNLD